MMKKLLMAGVMLLFLFNQNAGNAEAADRNVRATWLWNPWMIYNDEAGTLAFLESKRVNKVYVQIDSDIPATVYRSFIEKAAAKGMRIFALDGAPGWVAPNGAVYQDQLMAWIKTYQAGSTATQKFAGIHLDVEPYLYSGWNTNQATTVKAYQALLTKAKNSATALNLPLEADMPFWFDEISYKNTYGKGFLAEWVIAKTDSVTIMSYRDSAPLIIDLVKNEMAFGQKYGKTVVVGVETDQTNEGNSISFYEEGEAVMNEQLALVNSFYAGHAAFGGIAIHHVDSWKTMAP
ncbi:amidase [Planococcus sp. N028]|uniref:Amidase n=1 Tax=Planococcus shixiaomingii TaxID=3058393 RepID=A0ABT8N3K8_9BACL|nr:MULTISPECIES: amidase [unclassified Planococcus (in: firmicutes)]MDN7242454.1 amidase [Planococcus sp. N028]WKA54694.1 amidase [Planococcus sp. N022]